MRVRCEDCHHERLVAFSCKRRGFCCAAAGSPAPVGAQLSFPATLLLARHPQLMGRLDRTLSTHLIKKPVTPKPLHKLAQ